MHIDESSVVCARIAATAMPEREATSTYVNDVVRPEMKKDGRTTEFHSN